MSFSVGDWVTVQLGQGQIKHITAQTELGIAFEHSVKLTTNVSDCFLCPEGHGIIVSSNFVQKIGEFDPELLQIEKEIAEEKCLLLEEKLKELEAKVQHATSGEDLYKQAILKLNEFENQSISEIERLRKLVIDTEIRKENEYNELIVDLKRQIDDLSESRSVLEQSITKQQELEIQVSELERKNEELEMLVLIEKELEESQMDNIKALEQHNYQLSMQSRLLEENLNTLQIKLESHEKPEKIETVVVQKSQDLIQASKYIALEAERMKAHFAFQEIKNLFKSYFSDIFSCIETKSLKESVKFKLTHLGIDYSSLEFAHPMKLDELDAMSNRCLIDSNVKRDLNVLLQEIVPNEQLNSRNLSDIVMEHFEETESQAQKLKSLETKCCELNEYLAKVENQLEEEIMRNQINKKKIQTLTRQIEEASKKEEIAPSQEMVPIDFDLIQEYERIIREYKRKELPDLPLFRPKEFNNDLDVEFESVIDISKGEQVEEEPNPYPKEVERPGRMLGKVTFPNIRGSVTRLWCTLDEFHKILYSRNFNKK